MKMTIERIAEAVHEIQRAYCAALNEQQPSWEEAPDWVHHTIIDGVNFHLSYPDASPSASHENWMKLMTAEGWTYGPGKDPEKKQHPCYLPFDQLPAEQKAKDFLFRQTVHSLAAFLRPTSPDLSTTAQVDAVVYPSEIRTIRKTKDAQYGGGAHSYHILNCHGFHEGHTRYGGDCQHIQFVHKADDGTITPGLQSEQLVLVLLDRHERLNERFPSDQHEKMKAGLQMFMDACRERVNERLERGVMGDLKK